ncbi:MAG: Omp28-related outer membrane protein [Bacteroides sp.]|nr:Omp28-related outer membrane protein [Bacteroides sp.]
MRYMGTNKLTRVFIILTIMLLSSYTLSSCGEKPLEEIKEKIEHNDGKKDAEKKEQQKEKPKQDKEETKEEREEPNEKPKEEPKELKSNLVIIDFTGQDCKPCSNLLRTSIKRITENTEFTENVFFVAMHCFYSYSRDLYNAHSYEYSVARRVNGIPNIAFNNEPGNRNPILEYSIREFIGKKRKLKTDVKAELISENSGLDITITSDVTDKNSELKLQKLNILLWILENNIIARQTSISNTYNHQHVFRGYLGGNLWGEEYKLGETYHYRGAIPKKVSKATNCEVIAIILNAETKQFIDATKVKLK